MKSIALLTIGVIAGIAIGIFATSRSNQTPIAPEPLATAASQAKKATSPFALTKDTSDQSVLIEPSPNRPFEKTVETKKPPIAVSGLKHYREVIQYLLFIDTANSDELLTMLADLKRSHGNSRFAAIMNIAIYQRFSEVDIETAVEHAISGVVDPTNQYSHWAHDGLSVLASANPDYVRDRVENIKSTSSHPGLKSAMYAGIASNNPEQFVRQLVAGTDSNDRHKDEALSMAISEWANEDPQAAWDFLNLDVDEDTRLRYADQILYTWFERDPAAAFAEIEAVLNDSNIHPEQQMMLTDLYVSHLSKTDPQAAYDWTLSQSNPMVKESALMNMIYSWNPSDPTGLESFINQLNPEDRERLMPVAVTSIASKMAQSDPAGAISWTEQLPEQQRIEAQMSIVNEWAYTDPDAAADWLFSLPDSASNEPLFYATAGAFMNGDPETSKRIFSRMPAEVQTGLAEQMVYILSQQSPDAARQWLNRQNNNVQQIGSIALDSMDPNIDTNTILTQIANLQGDSRENLLFSTISQRMTSHRNEVEQWMASTTLLTSQEREMLEQMTSNFSRFGMPYNDSSDFYYRQIEY